MNLSTSEQIYVDIIKSVCDSIVPRFGRDAKTYFVDRNRFVNLFVQCGILHMLTDGSFIVPAWTVWDERPDQFTDVVDGYKLISETIDRLIYLHIPQSYHNMSGGDVLAIRHSLRGALSSPYLNWTKQDNHTTSIVSQTGLNWSVWNNSFQNMGVYLTAEHLLAHSEFGAMYRDRVVHSPHLKDDARAMVSHIVWLGVLSNFYEVVVSADEMDGFFHQLSIIVRTNRQSATAVLNTLMRLRKLDIDVPIPHSLSTDLINMLPSVYTEDVRSISCTDWEWNEDPYSF